MTGGKWSPGSWRACVLQGDIHEFRPPRGTGHEQQGRRYGAIVQADELLPRSVVLVAPTSHSARAASFRPEIDLLGEVTRVLVEQVGAVDWPMPTGVSLADPYDVEDADQPGSLIYIESQ